MKRSNSPRLLFPLSVLALLFACGKPPVPVETSVSNAPMPDGPAHPAPTAGRQAPSSHDGHNHDPNVKFAGVVKMTGELATVSSGFVFVSIKPEGIRMPSYSRKYALADAAFTTDDDGNRILRFNLTEAHSLGGLAPGAIVLEACFDPDGWVDTLEGQVKALISIEPGEQHAVLALP